MSDLPKALTARKEALLSHINTCYLTILDLEQAEERYVSELQIQCNGPESEYIFDTTLNNQVGRAELHETRTQIYDHALIHGGLMASLRQIDAPLAAQLNAPVFRTMLKRFGQLRREVDEYLAERGAVLERNMIHVDNNGVLMAKITKAFNFTAGF
ncbi:hypothetical protein BG015_006635 [Linnemannia schmuckeri]|uniref:Uncharacterized protein n=1 Tax=Linnemannia schmuckeri TaxID=64567 RepID=A0A9P5SA37_9FUNG|nr:hypothetical protein BG015_006635 [Linnemannia schmuckeri]